MSEILKPAFRRWAYNVAIAATLVLGVKGIVDADLTQALNVLWAAVFGVATSNVTENGGKHVEP